MGLCMTQAMTTVHDPPPTPSRMQVLVPAATFHALRQGREHQARLQLRDRLLSRRRRPKNPRGQKQYLRSDNMCSVLSYFPIVILLAFAFSLTLQIALARPLDCPAQLFRSDARHLHLGFLFRRQECMSVHPICKDDTYIRQKMLQILSCPRGHVYTSS